MSLGTGRGYDNLSQIWWMSGDNISITAHQRRAHWTRWWEKYRKICIYLRRALGDIRTFYVAGRRRLDTRVCHLPSRSRGLLKRNSRYKMARAVTDGRYWASLLIEMRSLAWDSERWEGGSDYRGVFCELSHTRAARNSQTHIRNDPRDDINDSNDATDPVDDDSVTNYTRMIIISRGQKDWKTTGSGFHLFIKRFMCVASSNAVSRLCFEMSNHL